MNIPSFGFTNPYSRVKAQKSPSPQFGIAFALPGTKISREEADEISQQVDEGLAAQRDQRARTERARQRNFDNEMDD